MKLKKRRKRSSSYILKSKKAMYPATMIFYYAACFLFAGFVIYAYIKIAVVGAKSTKFNMEYYVNDIGLMTDTMYAVPGDVEYDYKKDPSKFILDFKEDSLYVYTLLETSEGYMDQDSISSEWSSYGFMSSPENPFVKQFMFPVKLSFKKTGSILELSSTGVFEQEEQCPDVDTSGSGKNIQIEPGHSEDDPGHEVVGRREFEITKRISDSLKVLCRSHSIECTFLEQQTLSKRLTDWPEDPDIIISIHVGKNFNPEDKPFRAMYPTGSEKSEKLACLMGNIFREEYIVLDAIGVNLGRIRSDDYRDILSEKVPSVILEIGNINNAENFGQNSEINEIASNILKGIENYYSKTDSAEAESEEEEPQQDQQTSNQGNVKVITR